MQTVFESLCIAVHTNKLSMIVYICKTDSQTMTFMKCAFIVEFCLFESVLNWTNKNTFRPRSLLLTVSEIFTPVQSFSLDFLHV